jgi:hypothetical protein
MWMALEADKLSQPSLARVAPRTESSGPRGSLDVRTMRTSFCVLAVPVGKCIC